VEIDPDSAEARNDLGLVFAARGQRDEAIVQFRKALEIRSDQAEAHGNLGSALLENGQPDEGIRHLHSALENKPQADRACNLANALARLGRLDEAIAAYQKTLELKPELVDARYALGMALQRQGKVPEALAQWREAIRLQPDHVPSLNQLAWLSASSPDATVRNGAQAVELAQRAAKLNAADPNVLDTLAAAYAEAGRFPEALQTARQALDLATRQGNKAFADDVRARIQLYQTGSPYRDTQQPSPPTSARP
jgi:Flp pilus assembly protein TadD